MKVVVETLKELGEQLDRLTPGKCAGIHHDVFALFFPPGASNPDAREACLKFAQGHGCQIDNRPEQQETWFVKLKAEP
jgi:hypothetical protein